MQDPSIKQMAEQIAQDPAFAQMTAALQASVAGDEAGASGAEEKSAAVPSVPGGPAGLPTMDAEKYAQAMSNVLQNQHFMEMAEKLGQQIMSVCDPPQCNFWYPTSLRGDPGCMLCLQRSFVSVGWSV